MRQSRFEPLEARHLLSIGPELAMGLEAEDHAANVAEILVDPQITGEIKWAQPPVQAQPDNVFLGWNEPSVFGSEQIAADDFLCINPDPITGLTWWGSFVGSNEVAEPPLPEAFHAAIWTDVPVGDLTHFSRPGRVVWEQDLTSTTSQFVGWDFDPRNETYEATFRFDQTLAEDQWFFQDPARNEIYWLSISAVYPDGTTVDHPFGWKTLPRDPNSQAPDDAVVIYGPTAPSLTPTTPVISTSDAFPVAGSGYISEGPVSFATVETEIVALSLVSADSAEPILAPAPGATASRGGPTCLRSSRSSGKCGGGGGGGA